jgi:hypothetical protein
MPPGGEPEQARARVVAFLRALADRAEHDAALAGGIYAALQDAGLLAATPAATRARAPRATTTESPPAPDPFQVLRQDGDDALRAWLATLPLATLRQIVRAHRLDPARISARWQDTARIAGLIEEQVRARYHRGASFARV